MLTDRRASSRSPAALNSCTDDRRYRHDRRSVSIHRRGAAPLERAPSSCATGRVDAIGERRHARGKRNARRRSVVSTLPRERLGGPAVPRGSLRAPRLRRAADQPHGGHGPRAAGERGQVFDSAAARACASRSIPRPRARCRSASSTSADPRHIPGLKETIDELSSATDPSDVYQRYLLRAATRDEGSGLGLARIFVEADMSVQLELSDDFICVKAVATLPAGGTP